MKKNVVIVVSFILAGLIAGVYFGNKSKDNKLQIEWHEELFADIKFQSPFKFEVDPNRPPIPAEVEPLIKEFHQMRSISNKDVRVSIVKVIYTDQVNVSLYGAAEGSISAMAKELGDQTPIPNFEAIQGKPYDGFIGIYNTTLEGQRHLIRGAYFGKGQTLYMVIASINEGHFAEADIYKVFDSIEFNDK